MTDEDKAQLALGIIPDGFKVSALMVDGKWIRRRGRWYELPVPGKRGIKRTKQAYYATGEFEDYLTEVFWSAFKKGGSNVISKATEIKTTETEQS